jgi:hypothetical protein
VSATSLFVTPLQVQEALRGQQYIAGDEIATTLF